VMDGMKNRGDNAEYYQIRHCRTNCVRLLQGNDDDIPTNRLYYHTHMLDETAGVETNDCGLVSGTFGCRKISTDDEEHQFDFALRTDVL
jgi:hypothetical protein